MSNVGFQKVSKRSQKMQSQNLLTKSKERALQEYFGSKTYTGKDYYRFVTPVEAWFVYASLLTKAIRA